MYPTTGFTLGDVVDYYAAIAPVLLPHLRDRPVTLKRYPDTAYGTFFYEKDAPAFTPKWVKTFPVWRRNGESQIHYIVPTDARTLAWCAAVGTLEIHPFLCRVPDIDTPTEIVFDLDPGPGADILTCGRVAFLLHELLASLQLRTCVKVSGSKGLQVYLPLNGSDTYAATQGFARTVAQLLAEQNPKLVVAEMAKSERRQKIFIDWSQNADYKTTVSVYSLRAKRHRPYISAPIAWDELREAIDAKQPDALYFSPEATLERVAQRGDLFAEVASLRQELPSAFVESLGAMSKPLRATLKRAAAKSAHTSAQGGRRHFRVESRGSEFVLSLNLEDRYQQWRLPALPKQAAQHAVLLGSRDALARTSNEIDFGTFELVVGSMKSGLLDIYLDGENLRGEWLLERGDNDWTMRAPKRDESALTFVPAKAHR